MACKWQDCDERERFVEDYLLLRIDPVLAKAFSDHLPGCESCAAFVAQEATLIETLRVLLEQSGDA